MSGSVLIIDGDQAFAETAQNALEAAGLEVWVRQDGTFDTVRELRPNVLMLNVELPRGSGFAICSRIRRDKELKTTPILLTSAETTTEAFKRHAQSADSANDYAQKPITIDDVVDRVGKLIALAPADGAPSNGSAAAGAVPPPIPPPLKKQAAEETPIPAPPTLAGSGEHTPIPTRGLGSDDLWPSQQYDDTMRSALLGADVELPKGRVSPEERLQVMRALVKQHEQQKKIFSDTWMQANHRGQELARRIVGLTSELEAREAKIKELDLVQQEFGKFQEEITRIFQEKDAEEAEKASYLEGLERMKAEHEAQLQVAFERQTDDERRLNLIQEDLELLQNEKDAAELNLSETEAALSVAKDQIGELEKRLEMTNDVARDRAEEIGSLRDQLDQVAFDHEKARRQLEQAHEDKIEALLSEHVSALEEAREQQEKALEAARAEAAKELDEAETRHADLVEALTTTNEGEIADAHARIEALDRQHKNVLERADDLKQQLDESERSRIQAVGALEADLESYRERNMRLESDLDETTAQAAIVNETKSELEAKLGEATAALENAKAHIQKQSAELDSLRTTVETQRERIDVVEGELDTSQAELFERNAQANHLEKQLSAIESRATDLQTSLELAEKTLRNTDNELRAKTTSAAEAEAEKIALEQQVGLLEEQHSRLEAKVRDAETMLENERERFTKAEDAIRKARERVATLEADDTAERLANDLEAERAARNELDLALAEADGERKRLASTLADRERDVAEMSKAVERLEGQREDLNNALDEAETRLESIEQQLTEEREARGNDGKEIQKERAARKHLQETLDSTQKSVAALEDAIEKERSLRATSEAELDELETKISSLEGHVATERKESEGTIESLQKRVSELEHELASTSGAQRSGESRIKELEVQLATARSDHDSAATQIGALEKRLEAARTAAASSGDELRAALDEKAREVANLESVLANLNEELEIHRAQAQGLTQSADRAERATEGLTTDLDAARRSIATLERSEKALMERVAQQEDSLNEWRFATESMKGTLAALQRDLETASSQTDNTGVGKSFEQLIGRISRAVSMCMDTLEESEESMDLPVIETSIAKPAPAADPVPDDATDDDVDIPIYTGEVEPLDPLSDLEEQGLRIVSRTPVTPVNNPEAPPLPPPEKPAVTREVDAAEPFAALMAELERTVEPPEGELEITTSGFGDSFEGEATTNDTRAITASTPGPIPHDDDDEDEERNVTEIININDLE